MSTNQPYAAARRAAVAVIALLVASAFFPGAVLPGEEAVLPGASAPAQEASGTPASDAPAHAAPGEASLEVRAFRFLNGSIATPFLDTIMPYATDFDKWRAVVVLVWCALVLFGKTKGRWAALMMIPVIVASDQISSSIIKPLVGRVRPCEVLGNVHLWYGPEGWITTPAEVSRSYKSSFSFPSSHAVNITASMLFLGLVYRRSLVPLLAVAFVVSFSRIYIGVHWPSDVVGGVALGALIAWAAYAIYRRAYRGARAESEPVTRSEPDTPPSG